MLRVTADSNIISALHFGGPPDDFLNLARAGSIHLTISDAIVDEVTRALEIKFPRRRSGVRSARPLTSAGHVSTT